MWMAYAENLRLQAAERACYYDEPVKGLATRCSLPSPAPESPPPHPTPHSNLTVQPEPDCLPVQDFVSYALPHAIHYMLQAPTALLLPETLRRPSHGMRTWTATS